MHDATTPHQAGPLAPAQGFPARVRRRPLRWSEWLARASRWTAGLSAAALASLATVYPTGEQMPLPLSLLLVLAAMGMLAAAPLLLVLSQLLLWLPGRSAQVYASAAGLQAQLGPHARAFDAATITLAVVVPLHVGAALHLTLTSGDELVVWVDSVATADALLAALALDSHCLRTDVRWNPWAARIAAGVVGFVSASCVLSSAITLLNGHDLVVPLAFLLLVTPFLAAGYLSRRMGHSVSLGSDGVRTRRALGTQQLDLASVRSIEEVAGHLVFERTVGPPLRVSLLGLDPARRAWLVARAQQALERFAQLAGSRAEPFLRGGRPFDEWTHALQGLLPRESGFRSAAIRREDALRVAEDPTAPPDARVGAVLALLSAATERERERVRVAAVSSTYPKVRVALEAALAGDVDEARVVAASAERASV